VFFLFGFSETSRLNNNFIPHFQVEQQVEEQLKKINAVKANISKNDVRIQQLLRMVLNV
jgi:hypothetical protein